MTSKKQNKSYFLPYLRYKLSRKRPQIIIFAVFNLIILILPVVLNIGPMFSIGANYEAYIKNLRNPAYSKAYDSFNTFMGITFFLGNLIAVVSGIMLTVISAMSFKYYHNRAAMDTLGCLPLSYEDRFFGDYFGGLLVNLISFIPLFIISFIMTFIMELPVKKIEGISTTIMGYPSFLRKFFITLLLMYISIHAITAFVTSCCGRLGNSITFSFVTMLIMPGLFTCFGMSGYYSVPGIDILSEIEERVGMFPPFGWIFSTVLNNIKQRYYFYLTDGFMSFAIESALNLIVMLLITAAFIVGAYIIGKHRKAECTEQSFAFNGAYHIISLTLIAMLIGFIVYYSPDGGFDLKTILKALGITFFVYLALELSKNKSFKGFWKSLLRYGCVFGASFGFLILMRVTGGFGEQNRIPAVNSIDHVKISGDYFYGDFYGTENTKYNIIRDKSSISAITDGHRRLLDNVDKLSTGEMLELTYATKGGGEIKRFYSCEKGENDIIKEFSNEIKKLEFSEKASLGFLDDPDFNDLNINYNSRKKNDPNSHVMRAEKMAEFVKILKNNVIYNYDKSLDMSHDIVQKNGDVTFRTKSANKYLGRYTILPTYKDTIAFLEDPDNFLDGSEVKEGERYNIYYLNRDGFLGSINIVISSDDESEAVKRFIGLLEAKRSETEYSTSFIIYGTKNGVDYGVRKENETEAKEALAEVFREKVAQ